MHSSQFFSRSHSYQLIAEEKIINTQTKRYEALVSAAYHLWYFVKNKQFLLESDPLMNRNLPIHLDAAKYKFLKAHHIFYGYHLTLNSFEDENELILILEKFLQIRQGFLFGKRTAEEIRNSLGDRGV